MEPDLYPYASGNLIEQPNSYFYTPYSGAAFFDAWRESRQSVRRTLPDAVPPPAASPGPEGSNLSSDLLERALGGDQGLREAFIKKFETTKRVHESYDGDFRAVDKTKRDELSLYVRAADLFEASYQETKSSRHLNVYLKSLDTLCAHAADLSPALQARLAWHIKRENRHLQELAENCGVDL